MIIAAQSAITTVLPVAVVVIPVLIATFAIASMAEAVLEALHGADAPSGTFSRTVGLIRHVALRALSIVFALMLIGVSGAALLAQRDFEAFAEQQQQRR